MQPSYTSSSARNISQFCDEVEASCIPTVLGWYLSNDSLLDMFKHAKLYNTLFELLVSFSGHEETKKFVLESRNGQTSLFSMFSGITKQATECLDRL